MSHPLGPLIAQRSNVVSTRTCTLLEVVVVQRREVRSGMKTA